jgi:hypothetical protein
MARAWYRPGRGNEMTDIWNVYERSETGPCRRRIDRQVGEAAAQVVRKYALRFDRTVIPPTTIWPTACTRPGWALPELGIYCKDLLAGSARNVNAGRCRPHPSPTDWDGRRTMRASVETAARRSAPTPP